MNIFDYALATMSIHNISLFNWYLIINHPAIRIFSVAPRRSRPVVVQWSLTAKSLLKNFSVRRVLFDTGFGFRVQIDLVPRAFSAALNPKP